MSQFTPQDEYFEKANKWDFYRKIFFIISTIASIICTFMSIYIKQLYWDCINNTILIVSLVGLFICDYQQDQNMCIGDEIRRNDLIGNSFNKKYNIDKSEKYYNNDEIKDGLYKLLVNIFESCFWSLEVSKKMKGKALKRLLILGFLILIIAIYGLKNTVIALPILQLFLSKDILSRYLTISNYNKELDNVFNDLKNIFMNQTNKNIDEDRAIAILLKYECNISNSKIMLDSELFDLDNKKMVLKHKELEEKWSQIKKDYKII